MGTLFRFYFFEILAGGDLEGSAADRGRPILAIAREGRVKETLLGFDAVFLGHGASRHV